MDVREFKVLYAKSGVKKRKLFADGVLRVRAGPPPTFIATLIGEDGCEVSKRTEKSGVTYSVGDEITFGAFVVQIDEEVQLPATVPTVSAPLISQRMPTQGFKAPRFSNPGAMAPIATKPLPLVTSTNTGKSLQSIRLDSSPAHENDDSFWDMEEQESQSHSTAPPATVLSTAPSSSSSLIRAPAQPSTSLFRNPGMSRNTLPKTASGPVEQDPSLLRTMRPHQITGADFLISRLAGAGADGSAVDAAVIGAILADEMGVGKTLTSISAMWAFIRRGGCKCLVVCPSSLVDNWLKELRHWLGTRLKPLSLKPGADAAAVINTFAISLPSLYPLMVLSYEMFRKHAALLNTVPHLELVVCDEGHRLKNIGGTKTMDALRDCKARRRIILSGTPIQNDLDELYAVVAFVAPGLLGSLAEFKRRIAGPIARSNEEDATPADREAGSEAAIQLRDLLSKVMLRRTQAEILTDLLPPRRDYVIYCALTPRQRVEYTTTADSIIRDLGGPSAGSEEEDDLFDGEAEEVSGGSVRSSAVLAGLQSLRGTCTAASRAASGGGGGKTNFLTAKALGGGAVVGKENVGPVDGSAGDSGPSAKLQVLMRFLTVLRRVSPHEKVVIVSNFTTALDEIDAAVGSRWGESLRLDGRVPVDQRQALVNRFNKVDDPSFLFLLSAKAGGVGINLVGASRLVMFDVDWNPSVDHQAMSRIWREGQRRKVHIYRLVTAGTIEEAILQRQRSKNDLAGMVEGDAVEALAAAPADDLPTGWPGISERRMSLTRSDVLQLIYPYNQTGLGVHEGSSRSSSISASSGLGEEVMDAVMRELGSKVIIHATAAR